MLLLMSTDHPKSSASLSLLSVLIPRRKNSRASIPEKSILDPESHLSLVSLGRTSKSSNSEESRSISSVRSTTYRGREWFREQIAKFKSSLKLSKESLPDTTGPLRAADFREVYDWLSGFEKYNRFITNQYNEVGLKEYPAICTILTNQCGGAFFHGLPEAVIDLALLWCPSEKLSRKEGTSEPSWSWTGWESEEAKTLLVNFPFDHTSCPDVRRKAGNSFKSLIKGFYLGPLDAGLTDQPSLSKLYKLDRQTDGIRTEFPQRYYVPRQNAALETKFLHFKAYTTAASAFKLEPMYYENGKDMPVCELIDKENNKQCGVIMDYEDLLSRESKDPGPKEKRVTGPLQLVLMSSNRQCDPNESFTRPATNTTHPPGTPVWQDGRFLWDKQVQDFDESFYREEEWSMLNIMLIQWLEKGYAERVAIGRIHKDAWEAKTRTWDNIVLG